MRGPLTVVLDDGVTVRHVTDRTSDLRFSRTATGGDKDLSCQIRVDRNEFTDLGPNDRIRIYDARTAALMWSGDTNSPGVTDGPTGQLLDLQALGQGARFATVRTALGYVHTDGTAYGKSSNTTKGAQVDNGERPDGTPTIEVSWNKGYGVDSGDIGEQVLRAFQQARLKVGRFRADIDAGLGSAGYKQRLMSGTDVASLSMAAGADASTSAGSLAAYVGSGISNGDDVLAVRAVRSGADETAAKLTWFRFWNVTARHLLVDKHGADITDPAFYTGSDANQVYVHEVIADMIGRGMCPGLDPDKVTIANFTYGIDALAWLDGITMSDAMQALLVFERDLWWAAYDDAATFALWDPTNPRYSVSKTDGGITQPGEDNTLCDRILVSGTDTKGKTRSKVVTATVPGLDYTRDADGISLPDGTWSDANAQRAGLEALRITNNPPRAGTAVIRRPIFDRWAGCMVLPHEIMPGCVAVEQETGNPLRLMEIDYADADGAATLTLGEPVRTIAQRLARLKRQQRRRKS